MSDQQRVGAHDAERRAAGLIPHNERVVVAGDVAARVGGFAIDATIVSIGSLVLLGVLAFVHGPVVEVRGTTPLPDRVVIDDALFAVDTALVTLLAGLYFVVSWVRGGATPGQRAFGLSVLPLGVGETLNAGRACIRFVALGSPFWVAAGLTSGRLRLLMWVCGLAWYAALATSVVIGSRTTGLHDRLARTMVIRRLRPLDPDTTSIGAESTDP